MTQKQSSEKTCPEDGCTTRARARGMCFTHYGQWYRRTYPERVAESAEKGREGRREYARQYYLKNRERILAREHEKVKADPEYRKRRADRAKQWALDHPEQIRERRRRSWAKTYYGLTLEAAEAILARGCALCGTKEGKICLDHDHTSGKVRDALCQGCNTGLGQFGDDPQRLREAANYIEQHRKG